MPRILDGLNEQDRKFVQRMRDVWNYIGDESVQLCGGRCTARDARELVGDRMTLLDDEKGDNVGKEFYDLPSTEHDRLLAIAFPKGWSSSF